MGTLGKHWKLTEATRAKMRKPKSHLHKLHIRLSSNRGRFKKGDVAWSKGKKNPFVAGPLNAKWNGGPIISCCQVCNKTISRHSKFSGKGIFCSVKCKGVSQLGKPARNWSGIEVREMNKIRSSLSMRKWRLMVYGRDGFTCKWCGGRGIYLETHHIVPVSVDKSKAYEVNNGITLCRPCHVKTLGKEKTLQVFFETLILNKLEVKA